MKNRRNFKIWKISPAKYSHRRISKSIYLEWYEWKWEIKKRWERCKNKNDYVSSCIINWVKSPSHSSFTSSSSRSSSEWACQWIDKYFNISGISLVVVGEFNMIFLIWNSTAVNGQAVEGVQVWGFSLSAIHWGNSWWIWEFSLHEVLHFIFIGEFECLVSLQNDEDVVDVGVNVSD